MSNALNTAVMRIMREIPQELLTRAFINDNIYASTEMFSLEERIKNEVITGFVLPELDLVGGDIVTIPLGNMPSNSVGNAVVYNIPLSATQGRHISIVHSIEAGFADMDSHVPVAQKVIDAVSGVQNTGSAKVRIVGPNVIACYDYVLGLNNFLRCQLENDGQLQNLSPAYHREFASLCVLAAKSLIYTKLAISLGSSALTGGTDNAAAAQFLDSYADASELFEEMIDNKMRRIFLLADKETHRRIIKVQI